MTTSAESHSKEKSLVNIKTTDDCGQGQNLPRDNFWGTNKVDENLCGALVKIRRQALNELKEAAYDLGCNAVIGVDFDYLTMGSSTRSSFEQFNHGL